MSCRPPTSSTAARAQPRPRQARTRRHGRQAHGRPAHVQGGRRTVGRTTGPVVTQFEVEPNEGVKVRQIANLSNDLALAMRAQTIRIVAPIPGRGAVGVEVPNPTSEIVALRELIENATSSRRRARRCRSCSARISRESRWSRTSRRCRTCSSRARRARANRCASTPSSRASCTGTRRARCGFLMVDPKMVELSVYNKLPHLRHKVITDNRDAASVLKWAQMEMQQRYELCAENGCRNIQEFNKRLKSKAPMRWPKQPNVAFEAREYTDGELPYIVIVIDELADLMMTVQSEVETPLAILAQKARAIGIHLILATQRPSVNVITGLIKANFPSRIAFRVASQVDSRTIIDGMGAESLLGNGDMLFIPPGKSDLSRIPGRLSRARTPSVCSSGTRRARRSERRNWRSRACCWKPRRRRTRRTSSRRCGSARPRRRRGRGRRQRGRGERDKLFREAAESCIQNQGGSTSLLQRRLEGRLRARGAIDRSARGCWCARRQERPEGSRGARGSRRISIASAACGTESRRHSERSRGICTSPSFRAKSRNLHVGRCAPQFAAGIRFAAGARLRLAPKRRVQDAQGRCTNPRRSLPRSVVIPSEVHVVIPSGARSAKSRNLHVGRCAPSSRRGFVSRPGRVYGSRRSGACRTLKAAARTPAAPC